MNLEDFDPDGLYKLTDAQFYDMCKGQNVRDMVRETDPNLDEHMVRGTAAIMLVMFEVYPGSLSQEEVYELINRKRYDLMEDGAFQMEVRDAVSARLN